MKIKKYLIHINIILTLILLLVIAFCKYPVPESNLQEGDKLYRNSEIMWYDFNIKNEGK